jgi:hypothetical protein
MEYNLDTNAAKQADSINSRIDQSGKYLGVLTRAEQTTSSKGTAGVDLSFKSDTGASADYLTLWTHNKDGKQLQGFNTLMAIMTCLRVKSLKAEQGEVEKYDNDLQKRVKVVVPLFKELMNKPIGLLIHMEEYEKRDQSTTWKPAISGAFDKDEFTASEILNKAKAPETLAKMVQALRDRPLKAGSTPAPAKNVQGAHGGGFDDMDDGIPFRHHGAGRAWRVM